MRIIMLSLPLLAVVASLSKGIQVRLIATPFVREGFFPQAKDVESFQKEYRRAADQRRQQLALRGLTAPYYGAVTPLAKESPVENSITHQE